LSIQFLINSQTSLVQAGHFAHVWRAGQLGAASAQTVSTGYAALSHALPGGGWPCGAMTEVLQSQPGQHEWGLVAPALGVLQAASPDALVVLVGAPYCPFGPALGARQLNMQRLLSIHSIQDSPAMLWATREALQCADVGAVLAWLPDARGAHLRRLQIAALGANKLLFVFRPLHAEHDSSPAPLRLKLTGMNQAANGEAYNLQIDVFKRRGPTLAAPVLIDTRPPRLAALLAASKERVHQHEPEPERERERELEAAPEHQPSLFDLSKILRKPLHALDRTASLQH
jgi:protein ImuA